MIFDFLMPVSCADYFCFTEHNLKPDIVYTFDIQCILVTIFITGIVLISDVYVYNT